MKKIVLLAIAACFACCAACVLWGCNLPESTFTGHWSMAYVTTTDGTTTTAESLAEHDLTTDSFVALNLVSEEHAALLTYNGADIAKDSDALTWSTTEDGIKLTDGHGDYELKYDEEAQTLTMELNTQTVVFVRTQATSV